MTADNENNNEGMVPPTLEDEFKQKAPMQPDPNLVENVKRTLSGSIHEAAELEAVYEVPVQISAVLGRTTMPVHNLLKLGRGAIIELDRRLGEAIDIYVNNMLIARGEVVVVEDRLGITMTEIIKSRISS